MPDIKEHEYALLNEIAQDSKVTQANLSARLGIAVGSVNWYIKRLIHRGWVKVSRLDRTRLKYDLTPEGMTVFTQRAMMYARDSLKIYTSLRSKAKLLVSDLKHQGIKSVYLDGDDELMDILRLTCMESGLLVLDAPKDIILRSSGQGYEMVQQLER
jgi:DNA-binding MarR family transcriptional regulator